MFISDLCFAVQENSRAHYGRFYLLRTASNFIYGYVGAERLHHDHKVMLLQNSAHRHPHGYLGLVPRGMLRFPGSFATQAICHSFLNLGCLGVCFRTAVLHRRHAKFENQHVTYFMTSCDVHQLKCQESYNLLVSDFQRSESDDYFDLNARHTNFHASDILGHESYHMLKFMKEHDYLPSIEDMIQVFQICRKKKDLAFSKSVHAHVCKVGLEAHRILGNHLVQVFVECGSLSDAEQVFKVVRYQNVFTWTSVMSGYVQSGQFYQAIGLYEQMQVFGLCPTNYTMVALLKGCSKVSDLEQGRNTYIQVLHRGFDDDVYVGSSLVDMYGKCGSLLEAKHVFERLTVRNGVAWCSLITAFVESGCAQEALDSFQQMQREGVSLDAVTFISVLKACVSIRGINQAREIHDSIIKMGMEKEQLIGNSLVDLYAKCGSITEACDVFNHLQIRDVASWTSLITGYSGHASMEDLLLCFQKMQSDGISPDANMITSVLKICSQIGAVEKGRAIHRLAELKCLDCELFVCSALIDMYAKHGFLLEAQEMFDKLSIRDDISWNTLISGYAEHGPYEEALNYIERMEFDGVFQGLVTFLSGLKACANMAAVDKGQDVYKNCVVRGFDIDISIGSSAVDMYAACGLLPESQHIFRKLRINDVTSWNGMIKAFGIHQQAKLALYLFQCMCEQGFEPDVVTFTCILKACGRSCLLESGQEIFQLMTNKYSFEPTVDHINCILDLLARAGHLAEARKVFETMPCSPSHEMQRVLLSACKTHNQLDTSLKCFEQVL